MSKCRKCSSPRAQTICTYCEEPLTADELEAPHQRDGDMYCDDCWSDNFEFICCLCRNLEDDEYQHRFLVVTEPTDAECGKTVAPGVYEIVETPYYGGPIIGRLHMFADSIRRVADLPAGIDADGCPCGHLCRGCANGVVGVKV